MEENTYDHIAIRDRIYYIHHLILESTNICNDLVEHIIMKYLNIKICQYADLNEINLSYAYLSDTDLDDANLSGANLYGACLKFSCLVNANLSSANLSGAHLFAANLFTANLSGANLKNWIVHLTVLDDAKLY
jgi:uncharacterized protein YjbI with pentapeptide repeats